MKPASPMPAPPLVDRLRQVAQLWIDATDNGSFARLGRMVVNDGGIFTRLEMPGASTTTATLERFARFLGDATNWPDGAVPAEVCAFAHVVGVYSEACPVSPDMRGENIGGGEPACPQAERAA